MFALAFIAMLGFITTPPTPYDIVHPDGVVAHVDYTDNPCKTRGPWAGCSQMIDGVQHIWHSGVAPGHIVEHEKAHKPDGLVHGGSYWHRYFGPNCMNITQGVGKYPTGGVLCVDDKGRERIIPAGYQDEDCMECRVPGRKPTLGGVPVF